ncbi:MAG: IS66 family insertion sequence element accessory protein TnpB [Bacteroidetes bacterium]|nr:IS66 family insertion sequence element accessory protein TnpB [Bacteroidota bacterium]MBL0054538.1 IS66 family insertion sequence element accessory protein TnpB [Bacteroidota bacterium]
MQITFPATTRYHLYAGATDMRKGYNSLCGLVQMHFHSTVLSGDVFIFINRPRNRIKLLQWQHDGYAIYQKRLERGTYEVPVHNSQTTAINLSAQQLQFILEGIMLSSIKKRKRYEHAIVDKS